LRALRKRVAGRDPKHQHQGGNRRSVTH
jgi:hypothetical protein